MEVTIGIPAYKAQNYICNLLDSIKLQTISNQLKVIIASDAPEETKDYLEISKKYDLNIKVLDTLENTGPGLARQRCINNCQTEWIIFADADDVFFTPTALESFINEIDNQFIMIQGNFLEELSDGNYCDRHQQNAPWVFSKLYYIPFLIENNIKFSNLRVMEDCEFNQKIRLIADNKIKYVFQTIYLWKYNKNSISHNDDYKWKYSQDGLIQCCINNIIFYLNKYKYDIKLINFIVIHFIELYFNYLQVSQLAPEYLNNMLKCCKKYYIECYKPIEQYIQYDILLNNYMIFNYAMACEQIPIIPSITLFQFIDMLNQKDNIDFL